MPGFSLVPGGRGHNYTGMLTRSIVFAGALMVFLAATALTIAAIVVPTWISFDSETNHGTRIHYTYGLHRRCSNTNQPPSSPPSFASSWSSPTMTTTSLHCVSFPQNSDCHGDNRYFCSMWRSVGFLMSFAVVLEGMTIASYFILLVGGKEKREHGWGALAIINGIAAIVQAAGMALIAYLFENDERFFVGWYLDKSWSMCTLSWSLQIVCALAITGAALFLPSEGGYELIPDHDDA